MRCLYRGNERQTKTDAHTYSQTHDPNTQCLQPHLLDVWRHKHLPSSVTASVAAGQRRLNSNEALSTLAASAMPHRLSSTHNTACFNEALLCTARRSGRPTIVLSLLCTECATCKTNKTYCKTLFGLTV